MMQQQNKHVRTSPTKQEPQYPDTPTDEITQSPLPASLPHLCPRLPSLLPSPCPAYSLQFMLLPAPGDHLMWYHGIPVMVSRQRATGNPQMAANNRLMLETMRLIVPAGARRSVEAMLEEARVHYQASQSQRTSVYKVDPDGYWEKVRHRSTCPAYLRSLMPPHWKSSPFSSDGGPHSMPA